MFLKATKLNQPKGIMSHQSQMELRIVLLFIWINPAPRSRLPHSCPRHHSYTNLSWASPLLIMFLPPSRQDDCLKNQRSSRTNTTRLSMPSPAELSKSWCLLLKKELIMFKQSHRKASHPQKSSHMEARVCTTQPSKMWTRVYWSPSNKNE